MRTNQFKVMKKAVVDALTTKDVTAPIWYAGYLWIDLTQKQAAEMVGVFVHERL